MTTASTLQEIELKLALPDDADDRLQDAPMFRGARPRRVRLDATYFDTPDRLLQRHGMALRLRRAGRQWMQTLKATANSRGGLSTRPEWEAPARLVRGQPRLDLTLLAETPLPGLLARHRARRRLKPAFRVRVARTVWDIEYRRSRIEVALDRGRIEGVRDGERVAVPVAELELELKDGRTEDLVDRDRGIELCPLLLYIVTHEMVHAVRFGTGFAAFHAPKPARSTEERRVHKITCRILRPVVEASLQRVLDVSRREPDDLALTDCAPPR